MYALFPPLAPDATHGGRPHPRAPPGREDPGHSVTWRVLLCAALPLLVLLVRKLTSSTVNWHPSEPLNIWRKLRMDHFVRLHANRENPGDDEEELVRVEAAVCQVNSPWVLTTRTS